MDEKDGNTKITQKYEGQGRQDDMKKSPFGTDYNFFFKVTIIDFFLH